MKAPSEENYDKLTRGKGRFCSSDTAAHSDYFVLMRLLNTLTHSLTHIMLKRTFSGLDYSLRFQTTVLTVALMLRCYVRLSSVTLCIVAKRCVLQQSRPTVDLTDNL